jgi:hypothetical protein
MHQLTVIYHSLALECTPNKGCKQSATSIVLDQHLNWYEILFMLPYSPVVHPQMRYTLIKIDEISRLPSFLGTILWLELLYGFGEVSLPVNREGWVTNK